jgi:hypothetical protein
VQPFRRAPARARRRRAIDGGALTEEWSFAIVFACQNHRRSEEGRRGACCLHPSVGRAPAEAALE